MPLTAPDPQPGPSLCLPSALVRSAGHCDCSSSDVIGLATVIRLIENSEGPASLTAQPDIAKATAMAMVMIVKFRDGMVYSPRGPSVRGGAAGDPFSGIDATGISIAFRRHILESPQSTFDLDRKCLPNPFTIGRVLAIACVHAVL